MSRLILDSWARVIREDVGCLVLDLLVSLLVEGSQCYFSLDHTKIDL